MWICTLHRSVISRIDDRDELIEWVRIDNDPEVLVKEVRKAGWRAPVAVEATYGWYWAVDALQAAKFDVHLAHPFGMMKMRKANVAHSMNTLAPCGGQWRVIRSGASGVVHGWQCSSCWPSGRDCLRVRVIPTLPWLSS